MHHVALKVDSEAALESMRQHIAGFNVPVSEIRTHDFVKSIHLHDPNGLLIEIAYQFRPLTAEDFAKDPRPVAAVREMLAD
jgi:catechol-2,3-dioxygenase